MVVTGLRISSAKKGGISCEKGGIYLFKYMILIVLLNLSYLIRVLVSERIVKFRLPKKMKIARLMQMWQSGSSCFCILRKKGAFFARADSSKTLSSLQLKSFQNGSILMRID